MIIFSNLCPLSSTGYMNLGRALFLHDLITDVEIDVCSHIFHIVAKTIDRTASRNCIPFFRLISRISKVCILRKMSAFIQGRVQLLSTLRRIPSKKVMLLKEAQVLHPMFMMYNQTTSWLLSKRLLPRYPDQLPLCTLNTIVSTPSSHLFRLNQTKFKGSQRNMKTSYSMTKRGRWCRCQGECSERGRRRQ